MGFFDRFKKAPPAAKSKPENSSTVVPEGHEVIVHDAPANPGVTVTKGGMVIASLGVAGDDPDSELDGVLRRIEAALRRSTALATLVKVNRAIRISELFAPADPEILRFRSPVTWVFHRESVASIIAEPRRLQALLRSMHRISLMEGATIPQSVYLVDPPSPTTLPFVRLLHGLELPVKRPDVTEGGLTVLIEIKRPEGVILCLVAGAEYPTEDGADTTARIANEAKDRAEAAGNDAELQRLEAREREDLAARTGVIAGAPQIVLRAPRLRQMILAVQDGAGDEGLKTLVAELHSRAASLFFIKNLDDNGIEVRSYGAAGRALPIFADLHCLEWAAEDLGKPPGSFAIASVHPRQLIAMAAGGGMGLAICTFRDRKTPVYAILPESMVATMARTIST